jgi:4-alpha-glucanotransferase
MNTPSLYGGNWRWRFDEGRLNSELAAKMALLTELSDRLPKPFAAPTREDFVA